MQFPGPPNITPLPAINWASAILRDPPTENVIGTLKISALHRHLLSASRASARFALHSYTSQDSFDRLQSAVAAGSAVEYLLRCVVLAGDPVLLAHRSSVDSMIALSRAVSPSAFDAKALRTIEATDALAIAGKLHPTLKTQNDAREVFALRNTAIHMAIEVGDDLETAVVQMVRVVDELLTILGEQETEYWGTDLLPVIGDMKKKAGDALLNRANSKIAAAKKRFRALTASLQGSISEPMFLIMERKTVRFALDEDGVDVARVCPACSRRGHLSLIKEQDPSSYELVGDPQDPSNQWVMATVTGIPEMFQCPVCELRLDGGELAMFAGLHEPIPLPDEMVDYPREVDDGDWDH